MRKRITYSEFSVLLAEKYFEYVVEYPIVGKYLNGKDKILFIHQCGYRFIRSFSQMQKSLGCPRCYGRISKMTHSDYVYYVTNNEPDYEVVGLYNGCLTKITMKHLVCGLIWDTRPSDFKRGHGCPDCNDTQLTHEEFVEWVKK